MRGWDAHVNASWLGVTGEYCIGPDDRALGKMGVGCNGRIGTDPDILFKRDGTCDRVCSRHGLIGHVIIVSDGGKNSMRGNVTVWPNPQAPMTIKHRIRRKVAVVPNMNQTLFPAPDGQIHARVKGDVVFDHQFAATLDKAIGIEGDMVANFCDPQFVVQRLKQLGAWMCTAGSMVTLLPQDLSCSRMSVIASR